MPDRTAVFAVRSLITPAVREYSGQLNLQCHILLTVWSFSHTAGLLMTESPDDLNLIQLLVDRLYRAISFDPGNRPPIENLRKLFIPEARLINNNADQPSLLTIDQFISAFREQIESGAITSFLENEISHITELFGKVAHRFSTYESRFDPKSVEPFSVGINSIQMLKIGGKWKVSGMVWNDQAPDREIPERYLKQ